MNTVPPSSPIDSSVLTPAELAAKRLKHSQHLLIFVTVLIDLIGFGLLIPLIQSFASGLAKSGGLIDYVSLIESFILGIYSLMQFLFSPVLGRLSDRIGRRPVIIASLFGSLLGYLILAAATSTSIPPLVALTMVFGARIVTGICGASIGTAQAYLGDITAPEKRTAVMGMIGAAFGLGFVLGPLIGGVTNYYWGMAAPFFTAAGLTIVNLILCIRKLPESLPPEKRGLDNGGRTSLLATIRHMQGTPFTAILMTNLVLITAFSIMTTALVPFMEEKFGMNKLRVGLMFGFIGVIGILIQGGLIRKIARPGRERNLGLLGILLMIVALAFMPLTNPWASLLLVLGLLAVGNSFASPPLNSLASQCGGVQTQGETMGAMASAGSLGRFIGPFMAGIVMYLSPPVQRFDRAFWLSAALMCLAGVALLRVRSQRKN